MRATGVPAISFSPLIAWWLVSARRQHCGPLATATTTGTTTVRSRPLGFEDGTSRCWDKFYKRHSNNFFKDRHYLTKDWGQYFRDDGTESTNRKVVLEVGCGAGNSIFPLLATYPKLFVHACDFAAHAISLVQSHVDFNEDQVNAFVCDVANGDLCDKIMPSSVDVVTLIFMLSAVCPAKMPLILQNIRKVLKPNGCILLRDYAVGDYAQVELHKRNRMIIENFYIRGDGTCAFYFSEESLSTLFANSGFSIIDMDIYSRQIRNHSRNVNMSRRWIRATFCRCGIPQ
ncbi:tRNA(Thr) (cytosine(32)-N(3))-methyltransferase [Bertholletia excelsa]